MIWIVRIAVGFAGLFSLYMGLNMMLTPESFGAEVLGLSGDELGRSTMRADIGSFFLASAVASYLALLRRQPIWLYGGAFLYGMTALLRIADVIVASGPPPGAVVPPILVETVLCAVFLFGANYLLLHGNKAVKPTDATE